MQSPCTVPSISKCSVNGGGGCGGKIDEVIITDMPLFNITVLPMFNTF